MTPVEAMAKAYEEESSRWEWNFKPQEQRITITRMRDSDAEAVIIHECSSEGYHCSDAIDELLERFSQPAAGSKALLALAEVEFKEPIRWSEGVIHVQTPACGGLFKDICRALAEDKST